MASEAWLRRDITLEQTGSIYGSRPEMFGDGDPGRVAFGRTAEAGVPVGRRRVHGQRIPLDYGRLLCSLRAVLQGPHPSTFPTSDRRRWSIRYGQATTRSGWTPAIVASRKPNADRPGQAVKCGQCFEKFAASGRSYSAYSCKPGRNGRPS